MSKLISKQQLFSAGQQIENGMIFWKEFDKMAGGGEYFISLGRAYKLADTIGISRDIAYEYYKCYWSLKGGEI